MQTQTHVESGRRERMRNNTRHHIAAVASILCMATSGSVLAANGGLNPEQGIVDLATNYGESGVIASVVGISSGMTDKIEVTFVEPMNPGTFGMGVNFAKSWDKTWNADNTVLTIGGGFNFGDVAEATLIVYLMQTNADRNDISEPNIFKFQDINVTNVTNGNGQANVDFDILSANGKGYSVYIAESQAGPYTLHNQVNFNSKGAHIKGLENGKTYWAYLEYNGTGLVATRTAPLAILAQKKSGK